MVRTYKELRVWQRAFKLCRDVYACTAHFPDAERYGLIAQLRRAAVSIPSNIAEGHDRETTRDYLRFLWIARGSLAEVETQLMLATSLRLADEAAIIPVLDAADEVGRMLRGLIDSLAQRTNAVRTRPSPELAPRSAPLDPSPDPERRA
jgi:four helix bundle protein